MLMVSLPDIRIIIVFMTMVSVFHDDGGCGEKCAWDIEAGTANKRPSASNHMCSLNCTHPEILATLHLE